MTAKDVFNFNSIKVQLELAVSIYRLFIDIDFNSIKVQLEHHIEQFASQATVISIP